MKFQSHNAAIETATKISGLKASAFSFTNGGFEVFTRRQDQVFEALTHAGFTCKKVGRQSIVVTCKAQVVSAERFKIVEVIY